MAAAPCMPSWPIQSSPEHPDPTRMTAGLGQELRDPHSPKEPRLMFPLCSGLSVGPGPQTVWEPWARPQGVPSQAPPTPGLLPGRRG